MFETNVNAEYDNLDVIFQKALKMLRNVPTDKRDEYYNRMDAAIGNSGQSVMTRLNNLEIVMQEITRLFPAPEVVAVPRPAPILHPNTGPKHGGMKGAFVR